MCECNPVFREIVHDLDMAFHALMLAGGSAPQLNGVYTMYHGTSEDAAKAIESRGFKQSKDGMLGRGVYVSRDIEKASRYPLDLPRSERVILEVVVRVGRVKKIDRQDHRLQKTWHDEGYNTAWVPPNCGMVDSGLEEDCVWNPKRVKYIRRVPMPEETCRLL